MGKRVDGDPGGTLAVRLLGPLTVLKSGVEVPLPASRKVRALLAVLAVSPGGVNRSRLCELLWEGPSDPRGELRWCLSKLRGVFDDPAGERSRIRTHGESVTLDTAACAIDVVQVARDTQPGVPALDVPRLRAALALFGGEFADGLEIDGAPEFACWLAAQRRRFRALEIALLEQLSTRLDEREPEHFECLERWLALMPHDVRAHRLLLAALLRAGRTQEAESHFATTARRFESEGLDAQPVRDAWRAARQLASTPRVHMEAASPVSQAPEGGTPRARLCVMPFVDRSSPAGAQGGIADGLTEDIITRLAKLRVLFVIARGSVFALGERNIPPEEAGRLLNVDYVASGSVRRYGERIVVIAELAETRSARVVWADEFACKADDALAVPDEISNRIVANIAEELEAAERRRAILKPPGSLNAWEAYHRGLWHMYRFTDEDNARAAHFFHLALREDRTFARAYAGLSFTHFQNAFLLRTAERDAEIELAHATAAESLTADERDPAAHWAMGRALWLRGVQDGAFRELQQAIELSPNFALGHYMLGFAHSTAGDPRFGITATDRSRDLSPFDPMLFGMFGARAVCHLRLGEIAAAADWALQAAQRPNAHLHIQALAAGCLATAGRHDEARAKAEIIHRVLPGYRLDDFLTAFQLRGEPAALLRAAAPRIGLE